MNKIQWGILSTAKIGVQKVIPALQKSSYGEVKGIGSRSLQQAETVARKLDIPGAYGSYEELLADPDIDAVYIPLPNHLHVPWSIEALKAGKHVLCEKPIGLSSAEARNLIEASATHPHLKVMEAFMYRFHPQWRKAKELVAQGAVGELRTVNSFFSYHNDDPDNIRNKPEIGGGGLMDIGCYCVSLSRFLFEEKPLRVSAFTEHDPDFGTDRLTSGMMEFRDGTATFTCSTQLVRHQRVFILGTTGKVEIEIPFNAPPDKETRLWLTTDEGTEEIVFGSVDQYTLQGDAFALAILNDTDVPTPLTDAEANMKVIETLVESAERSRCIGL